MRRSTSGITVNLLAVGVCFLLRPHRAQHMLVSVGGKGRWSKKHCNTNTSGVECGVV